MRKSEFSVTRRPLYRQVMAGIRAMIRDRRPGDRLGTEAEFVRRFSVSLVTVRQACRELESEGVIERRQGSGTFVPEIPVPRRHVAVLLDADTTDPRMSPYFPKLVQKIQQALKARGLASRAYYGSGEPNGIGQGELTCEDVLDDARLHRLIGLISFHTKRHPSWTGILHDQGIPVLDFEFRYEQGLFAKSHFIRTALAHFRNRGKRRLAVLASENPKYPIQVAFREELRARAPQYGIELDDRLVDITASAWETGMGWERFRDLWQSDGEKPDSLIVLSDLLFADCQKAILELRIPVPTALDLLVASSDAMDLQPAFPIHVYRISTQAAAEREADFMVAMLNGEELPHLSPADATLEPQGPEPDPAEVVDLCT